MKKLFGEIIHMLPAIIYFWISFNLIYFTSGLTLRPDDHRYFSLLTVNLAALLVGKVLIIVNNFPFINAFPHKPLIYNILWKIMLYFVFIFLFWSVETWLHLLYRYDQIEMVRQKFRDELASPFMWSTLLWMVWILSNFVIVSEFVQALGHGKIKKIVFGIDSSHS